MAKKVEGIAGKDYLRTIDEQVVYDCMNANPAVAILYRINNFGYPLGSLVRNDKSTYFIHGCKKGLNKIQIGDTRNDCYSRSLYNAKCKFCGQELSRANVFESKFVNNASKQEIAYTDMIMFLNHPTEEEGIIIKRCKMRATLKNENDIYQIKYIYNVIGAVELIPGKEIKGYKILKNTIKEQDPFDALNINSKTIMAGNYAQNKWFEGSASAEDFFIKHPAVVEKTGFNAVLKNAVSLHFRHELASLFVLHTCTISIYPMLELLVKTGYTKLYFDLISYFVESYNKTDMRNRVANVAKLFKSTSKGSSALRIPPYIGQYLREKSADMKEYLTWCDIYELQPMSKEQFEKFKDSIDFSYATFYGAFHAMPQVMKYGYTIEKLTRFVLKQYNRYQKKQVNNHLGIVNLLNELAHYLQTCEYAEIEPNLYPSDIVAAHNSVNEIKVAKKEDYSRMEEIGKKTQSILDKYIDPDEMTEMEKKYVVIVPKSITEFKSEGVMQNSCVGNHARSVNKNERIVFFLREREHPEQSYITAEYVMETCKIGECMYKNNREVEAGEVYNYCNTICNRINTAVLAGKI